MEFESNVQKEVFEKIEPWMMDMFGIFVKKRDDAPFFGINIGSTFVHVGVYPWGEEEATITARAYVVTGVEVTSGLMEFLLKENDTMRFGAFGLDKDSDVFFQHTIVGSTCDADELKNSVLAVGYTADKYDDQIVRHWGGERAADRKE
ncbi:MAG: YbjN domain-containing protein [Anaerolineaceae bacterium]|nr:YbjN domain-containing protein [Anaerolineaceae bacterium]